MAYNNIKMTERGYFIVFEGLDRSGKTTQSIFLLNYLSSVGINAFYLHFPIRESETGKIIDQYLRNEIEMDDWEIHKLFSDNRREYESELRKHLSEGTWIICDRYIHSGVFYSAAKGLDIEKCKQQDKGLPTPDILFYLKIGHEETCQRSDYGNERYENVEFQKKVEQLYNDHFNVWNSDIIDALDTKENIALKIQNYIKRRNSRFTTERLGTW